MARAGGRFLRRARTASSLPGRLERVEDRCSALETHVAEKIDEMRAELAEIRALLHAKIDADADATELLGNLLQISSARLDSLEQEAENISSRPSSAP